MKTRKELEALAKEIERLLKLEEIPERSSEIYKTRYQELERKYQDAASSGGKAAQRIAQRKLEEITAAKKRIDLLIVHVLADSELSKVREAAAENKTNAAERAYKKLRSVAASIDRTPLLDEIVDEAKDILEKPVSSVFFNALPTSDSCASASFGLDGAKLHVCLLPEKDAIKFGKGSDARIRVYATDPTPKGYSDAKVNVLIDENQLTVVVKDDSVELVDGALDSEGNQQRSKYRCWINRKQIERLSLDLDNSYELTFGMTRDGELRPYLTTYEVKATSGGNGRLEAVVFVRQDHIKEHVILLRGKADLARLGITSSAIALSNPNGSLHVALDSKTPQALYSYQNAQSPKLPLLSLNKFTFHQALAS